jgi:hypothetical protein
VTHGFLRVAGVGAAMLILAACSKPADRANDSAAGATTAVPQRPPGPGELTKPLADYTGDELYALVQTLQYAGANTRVRRCQGLPGCSVGNPPTTTRVMVEGVVGEDSVPARGAIPRYGVIVVRARNLGGQRDAMYGMRPGNRFQYFLVVLPDTGGLARWQLEQLEVVGNNRTHSALAVGRILGCNHPFVRGARADFRTCNDPPLRPASTAAFQGLESPIWYGCEDGCCYTTSFGGI